MAFMNHNSNTRDHYTMKINFQFLDFLILIKNLSNVIMYNLLILPIFIFICAICKQSTRQHNVGLKQKPAYFHLPHFGMIPIKVNYFGLPEHCNIRIFRWGYMQSYASLPICGLIKNRFLCFTRSGSSGSPESVCYSASPKEVLKGYSVILRENRHYAV